MARRPEIEFREIKHQRFKTGTEPHYIKQSSKWANCDARKEKVGVNIFSCEDVFVREKLVETVKAPSGGPEKGS